MRSRFGKGFLVSLILQLSQNTGMSDPLILEMSRGLARSNAAQRKIWARTLIRDQRSLQSLFSLLHSDPKTLERFTWFIGDLAELSPESLVDSMPLLFDLKDQVEFPGITRSVAKWLLCTNVPSNIERVAIPQLMAWITDDSASISCKSFTAKVLVNLARSDRLDANKVIEALNSQTKHDNLAYRKRIKRLVDSLKIFLTSQ